MEYKINPSNKKVALPKKGYYKMGDSGEDINIIASFLVFNFLGYENKLKIKIEDVLGDYFGKNLTAWVKEFQTQNKLEVDGCIGIKTLNKMREFGFKG